MAVGDQLRGQSGLFSEQAGDGSTCRRIAGGGGQGDGGGIQSGGEI